MRSLVLFPACLFAIYCFNFCRTQETKHEIYIEADSLLNLTLALQLKIGSPEIQRIHEFQEEISQDMTLLSTLPEKGSSLTRYKELYNGLDQCMHACNKYHEEAFLLESSLREIMDRVQLKDADPKDLTELLEFETGNYNNLSMRIDSSLKLAIQQAEIYYSLKSEIDKIKEQAQLP